MYRESALKLFLNTQIPASLWFMKRQGSSPSGRLGGANILFIDARNLGFLINRRTRELSQEDISKIADTYHNWRNSPPLEGAGGGYEDIPGFCTSAPIEKIRELDFVVTPGRYVGLPDDEDDFDFNERFTVLKAELEAQLNEEVELNKVIVENLKKINLV